MAMGTQLHLGHATEKLFQSFSSEQASQGVDGSAVAPEQGEVRTVENGWTQRWGEKRPGL